MAIAHGYCITASKEIIGSVLRILGEGILPLKQGLLDVQSKVLSTHCPLLGYSCHGFLMIGDASLPHSFKELLQLKGP